MTRLMCPDCVSIGREIMGSRPANGMDHPAFAGAKLASLGNRTPSRLPIVEADLARSLAWRVAETLRLDDPDEERKIADGQFREALEQSFPDPISHASSEESVGADGPLLLLLPAVLVKVWGDRDGTEIQLKSEARPLKDAGVVVRLEWGPRKRVGQEGMGYETRWEFDSPGREAIEVRGYVQADPREELSEGEEFARAVRGETGFSPPDRPSNEPG